MTRPRLGRPVGALAAAGASIFLLAPACEPQEIFLYDPPPPSLTPVVDAGLEPEPEPAPSAVIEPAMAPPCETPACTECQDLGAYASQQLFCHPRTGACAAPCQPASADPTLSCAAGTRCEPELAICVACLGDGDCASSEGVCDPESNRCVECVGDAACPSLRPVCDPAARRCVECVEDADCALGGEVCVEALGRCVGCEVDADCQRLGDDDEQICDPRALSCVECLDDGDCGGDPDKPFCSSELECEDERE